MRGKSEYWKGVRHCYYSTKPRFLLSKSGLRKAGWKIINEKTTREAWTFGKGMWSSKRELLYHIGYCVPLAGEKARQRRLDSGFTKERVRQIQKNYPRQTSFFRQSFTLPTIEGNDIDPFDIEIEIEIEDPYHIEIEVLPLN